MHVREWIQATVNFHVPAFVEQLLVDFR